MTSREMNERLLKKRVALEIGCMTTEEQIDLHNNYCYATNTLDSYIYPMCDFDEIIIRGYAYTPTEIAYILKDTNFDVDEPYFTLDNGYGMIESMTSPYDYFINVDAIINYIVDENDALDNDKIQELLDKAEKENEE